jgi:hypothetical protein
MSRVVSLLVAFVALGPLSRGVSAQSVAEIVEGMYASAERQAEGIDDYTLVQTALGVETTSFFQKELVDGRPVFRLRDATTQGFSFSLGEEGTGVGDVFLFGPELVEHGRYAGLEQIGTSAAHVIAVDDLSLLDLAQPSAPGDMEFQPRTARLFIDEQMMIPRRMEFTGDAITPAGPREITVRVDMQRFLPVSSLYVPYRTVVEIEGLDELMGPETMAQLAEMQRQLDALSPDQREMMLAMMGPQMEMLRQMMSGGGDAMTVVVTIKDVFINTAQGGR